MRIVESDVLPQTTVTLHEAMGPYPKAFPELILQSLEKRCIMFCTFLLYSSAWPSPSL